MGARWLNSREVADAHCPSPHSRRWVGTSCRGAGMAQRSPGLGSPRLSESSCRHLLSVSRELLELLLWACSVSRQLPGTPQNVSARRRPVLRWSFPRLPRGCSPGLGFSPCPVDSATGRAPSAAPWDSAWPLHRWCPRWDPGVCPEATTRSLAAPVMTWWHSRCDKSPSFNSVSWYGCSSGQMQGKAP